MLTDRMMIIMMSNHIGGDIPFVDHSILIFSLDEFMLLIEYYPYLDTHTSLFSLITTITIQRSANNKNTTPQCHDCDRIPMMRMSSSIQLIVIDNYDTFTNIDIEKVMIIKCEI